MPVKVNNIVITGRFQPLDKDLSNHWRPSLFNFFYNSIKISHNSYHLTLCHYFEHCLLKNNLHCLLQQFLEEVLGTKIKYLTTKIVNIHQSIKFAGVDWDWALEKFLVDLERAYPWDKLEVAQENVFIETRLSNLRDNQRECNNIFAVKLSFRKKTNIKIQLKKERRTASITIISPNWTGESKKLIDFLDGRQEEEEYDFELLEESLNKIKPQ